MNRDEAVEYCKPSLPEYLQYKGYDIRKQWRCFEADTNPAHSRGDKRPSMGLIKKNPTNCTCGACKATYDIFQAVALLEFNSDKVTKEVFDWVFRYCGVSVDNYTNTHTQSSIHNSAYTKGSAAMNQQPAQLDISQEVEAAHKELYSTSDPYIVIRDKEGKIKNKLTYLDYLHRRGLTDEIIKAYKIGYDSQGINHFLRNHKELQSFIDRNGNDHIVGIYNTVIPVCDEKGTYFWFTSEISDRTLVDDSTGKPKYKNIKGYSKPIFNARYLITDTPDRIYIAEGIFTALSIEVAGEKAIALQGAGSSTSPLIDLCKKYRPKTKFIIAADNDPAGIEGAKKLQAALQELGYTCSMIVAPGMEGKDKTDFNNWLIKDKERLLSIIGEASRKVQEEEEEELEKQRSELQSESAANYIQGFFDRADNNKKKEAIKTGFTGLDRILQGGFYEGLYVIGAVSGAGKTAFTMQIADNIAAAGNDVYIFSLEMSRDELISRSISRLSLQLELSRDQSTKSVKTPLAIRNGDVVGKEQKELVWEAAQIYANFADHIFINEGVGDIDINFIVEKVKRHIRLREKPPVIIIDYLQILAPVNENATDKQNIDKAVLELKRLSRDYHIPVISISSFNRDNYSEPVNLASFKESGAIEYTASVIIGMEFPFMEYEKTSKGQWERDTDRKKRIHSEREKIGKLEEEGKQLPILCKILKNRDGYKKSMRFDFYSKFMYYIEVDEFSNYDMNEVAAYQNEEEYEDEYSKA